MECESNCISGRSIVDCRVPCLFERLMNGLDLPVCDRASLREAISKVRLALQVNAAGQALGLTKTETPSFITEGAAG